MSSFEQVVSFRPHPQFTQSTSTSTAPSYRNQCSHLGISTCAQYVVGLDPLSYGPGPVPRCPSRPPERQTCNRPRGGTRRVHNRQYDSNDHGRNGANFGDGLHGWQRRQRNRHGRRAILGSRWSNMLQLKTSQREREHTTKDWICDCDTHITHHTTEWTYGARADTYLRFPRSSLMARATSSAAWPASLPSSC